MKTAYFGLSFGVNSSCMPESYCGAYSVTTRKEIMAAVRDALALYELPKSLERQIKWKHVFNHAKRHGLSVYHFSLNHKSGCLNFHGMTQAEYVEWEKAND